MQFFYQLVSNSDEDNDEFLNIEFLYLMSMKGVKSTLGKKSLPFINK